MKVVNPENKKEVEASFVRSRHEKIWKGSGSVKKQVSQRRITYRETESEKTFDVIKTKG